MARTPIFQNRDASGSGFSLVELLVALAIISLAAGLAVGAGASMISNLSVRSTADTLLADLKRSRLEAMTRGNTVALSPTTAGYAIAELSVERQLPPSVHIHWPHDTALYFNSDGTSAGGTVTIKRGRHRDQIVIDPIFGQIRHER